MAPPCRDRRDCASTPSPAVREAVIPGLIYKKVKHRFPVVVCSITAVNLLTFVQFRRSAWLRKACGMPTSQNEGDGAAAMELPESMTRAEVGEVVSPAYAEFVAREALRQMSIGTRSRVEKPPTTRAT